MDKDSDFKVKYLRTMDVLRVWGPLASTWLMMAFEGPFLAAIIARNADPKYNLAAYGVAFSIGVLLEAPIIMIMAAAVRLVRDNSSFVRLRNFTYFLNTVITIGMAIALLPPVYHIWANRILALPQAVSDLTYTSTLLLLPWPAAIGYRRFYQGVLIHNKEARKVAFGTIVRLITVVMAAFVLPLLLDLKGASIGASCLSLGVVTEAVFVRLFVHKCLFKTRSRTISEISGPLTYLNIIRFYYPLALTAILGLVVQPLVTLSVGKGRFPIESLAVIPVINALIFIFRAVALSYQEVILSLMGDRSEGYTKLKEVAIFLSLFLVFVLGLISLTPVSKIWFTWISGLTPELAAFARTPTQIMILMPLLSLLLSWQRAFLIHIKKTEPITWASILELGTIALSLTIYISWLDMVGAIAAMLALMTGRIASTLFLLPRVRYGNIPGALRVSESLS